MNIHHAAGLFHARPDQPELERAARLLGAVGPALVHAFEPHGHSVAVLGHEVRVMLHTWPEHALVTVDVYADRVVDFEPLRRELGWRILDEGDHGMQLGSDFSEESIP
ncbi:MAG: S-adenosylmethionine decarboxylase [Myxococcota bacterium]